jgi:ferredoxin
MSKCSVWIDQDLCTGDGICCEIAPKVFEMHEDGLAYVKEVPWPNRFGASGSGPAPALQGADGLAGVPENLLEDVIEAMEACPGECIYLEVE